MNQKSSTRQLRWKNRPSDSNWGDFGPDDQLGRMNYVDASKVLEGVAEVVHGKTFCLSLPLDLPGGGELSPGRQPPRLRSTVRGGKEFYCYPFENDLPGAREVICDDCVTLSLQYSTQWDGFAHCGAYFDADGDGVEEMVFYNGYRAGEDICAGGPTDEPGELFGTPRAHALGIENLATHGVQGRGVLVDFRRHFGIKRNGVDYDALMRVLEADNVEVEKGDMLCFHTGMGQVLTDMAGKPDVPMLRSSFSGLNGADGRLLKWIDDTGVAALISDNYAVELYPADPNARIQPTHAGLPLHEFCLFKNGIHLGELWYLTPLAEWLHQNNRSRFLLTAPPLRLPGAIGSPPMPVATV